VVVFTIKTEKKFFVKKQPLREILGTMIVKLSAKGSFPPLG
jgi:hypothetical protein